VEKSCLAATKQSYDFCVKMTMDEGHEALVLQQLAPEYNRKYEDRQFYAIGTVNAVVDSEEEEKE
jgi:hypothetical protein